MRSEKQIHNIDPFYKADSLILILGSFPSVRSRESGFFYGHPRNRFWKTAAFVFGCDVPETIPEKKIFLERNRIALWDVIASCTVSGSSDSSIKDVTPNDISIILNNAPVKAVFTNGATASKLWSKYQFRDTGRPDIMLPSTSPANAGYSLEMLQEIWKQKISEFL